MRSQRGSAYSKLFTLVMLGAAVLVGLRVVPIYLNEVKVQSAIKGVASTPEARSANVSVGQLRSMLQRRWDVDDVRTLKVSDIKFVRSNEGRLMRYDYVAQTELFANWSLSIRFTNDIYLGEGS
nr:DUF4845 domain-containing protein [Oceanococcus sp. HetDA_MAG_MS8]